MTRRVVYTPYTSQAAECELAHHRPGSRVQFHQWDIHQKMMHTHTGRVIAHEGRVLTIALDPDGIQHTTSCGHVVAS